MRKKIKIVLLSISGISIVFLGILVYHIATVSKHKVDNATIQISRIDFATSIDSLKMKEIHRNLKSIKGFKNDSYNLENGVLVFFHDNRIADAKSIYNQLIEKGNYKAKLYVNPISMQSKQVCPVMEKNSFGSIFSRKIQQIFN